MCGSLAIHLDIQIRFSFGEHFPKHGLDRRSNSILQYIPRPEKDTGMFVPLNKVEIFSKATMIGTYGSNLIKGQTEPFLSGLLEGLLKLKQEMNHPLLSPEIPLALVTGGGPGVMKAGNKIAKSLGILSCARILDFSLAGGTVVNEQEQNPYIEAKMTYRLDRLAERQAEFHLDLPLFMMGGIGTDFEYALEEVGRKTGTTKPTPILLVGEVEYWKSKLTSRFSTNRETGTIVGSEWVSNCCFCVQTPEQGLKIYKDYFSGKLSIGPDGPIYDDGFKA